MADVSFRFDKKRLDVLCKDHHNRLTDMDFKVNLHVHADPLTGGNIADESLRRAVSSEICNCKTSSEASLLGRETRLMEQMLAEARFEEIVARAGKTVTFAPGESILRCNEKQVCLPASMISIQEYTSS
jgi:hypothetical protein